MNKIIDISNIIATVRHELIKNHTFFIFRPYKDYQNFADYIGSEEGTEICYEFTRAYLLEKINSKIKTSSDIINAARILERFLPVTHNNSTSVSEALYYNILELTEELSEKLLKKAIKNEWRSVNVEFFGYYLVIKEGSDFRIELFDRIFGPGKWDLEKQDLLDKILGLKHAESTDISGELNR